MNESPSENLEFYLAALEGLENVPAPARSAVGLTAAIRRLMAVSLASTAPDALLDEATAAVESLVDKLEPFAGGSGGQWGLDIAGAAGRYLCHPLTGPANPLAPPMTVSFDGSRVIGLATYGALAEGRFGTVHGSFLASAVVTMVSLVTVSNGRRGTLESLGVRYAYAAPLHRQIRYDAFIEEMNDVRTGVRVTARHRDNLLIDATAELAYGPA